MAKTVENLLKNQALLAPMAGITDLPFRRLAARFGAGLVISEMVASRELVTGRGAAETKAELDPDLGLTAVQIAGREPEWMAAAARLAEDAGAELIDINMGCPAKKVTSGLSGAALMREPDLALRLIEAVIAAVKVPVTVKMRLGWDDASRTAPDLARRAVDAGAAMITVHGRTRADFYKGQANWSAVGEVKRAIAAPVVVNGDIVDIQAARRALAASGADLVMIGRGAQGAPWVPGEIAAALAGKPYQRPDPVAVTIEHYEAILSFYGRDLGVRLARKHLSWALARLPGGASLRARVITLTDPNAVLAALSGDWLEAEEGLAA